MGRSYLHVARAYLRWPFLLASALFLALLAQTARPGWEIVAHSFAALPLMYEMLLGMFLGMAVKAMIAHPHASLVPNYRGRHLVVVSIICVALTLLPALWVREKPLLGSLAPGCLAFMVGLACGFVVGPYAGILAGLLPA